MQKTWMISAIAATLIYAQEMSIEEQLANQKTKPATTQSNFMPSISLILDASYTKALLDVDTYSNDDGFNLNYVELTLGASVDNYFDLTSVLSFSEDSVEIEEAYATTSSLPYHLRAKVGKFRSDFGYLNNKHEHAYNFAELPLIYNVFFGEEGLNEKGFQLQYILPTDAYMMAGIEILQGENEQSFGINGFSPVGASEDFYGVSDASSPSLIVGYLKTSFDIGGSTLLGGVSIAKGDSRIDNLEEEANAFSGDTTIYGMDLIYKNYFSADQLISWQSEYLYREMDGTLYIQKDSIWDKTPSLNTKQAGFYTQLIYQYDKNIKAGVRYSAISQNDATLNALPEYTADDIYVVSAMTEYNFSGFSRLRLQYNYNSSLYTEDETKNNKDEIILQFTYAIGAHGAHAF
jgi:hypothetical protein